MLLIIIGLLLLVVLDIAAMHWDMTAGIVWKAWSGNVEANGVNSIDYGLEQGEPQNFCRQLTLLAAFYILAV